MLDRVHQRLADAEQFRLFGNVAHVDAGRVLEPDHRHPVAGAQGHEFVHLDQSLAVELAANAWVIRVLRITLG